jgi:hypothetical protein
MDASNFRTAVMNPSAVTLVLICCAHAIRAEPAEPHYICTERFVGTDAGLSEASLSCTASLPLQGPIVIGYNRTLLLKHQKRFTGVELVEGLPCQRRAAQWSESEGVWWEPHHPLLFFCGKYHVKLVNVTVKGVQLAHNGCDFTTAVLAFGDNVTGTLCQSEFAANQASSMIRVMDSARIKLRQVLFEDCSG